MPLGMLGLTALLTGCSWGRDSRSAQATEQAAADTARDTMILAARATGATRLEAGGRWRHCSGGIGHQYSGGGVVWAPQGNVSRQLEAIRAALVEAGFTDVSQLKDRVSVQRNEITLTLRYHRTYRGWPVSFYSKCHIYRGADGQRVNSTAYRDLEGLIP
ncbi:hypothetical protein [Deinococcus arcticus]|nr:hypothetical protein [Deinococcus arcticus]